MIKHILINVLAAALATSIVADSGSHLPTAHAPIGVMGDHTHAKGEHMFSYRYMAMEMDGAINGQDKVSSSEVFNQLGFAMAAHESMTMKMHMLGYMFGLSDKVTLMTMVNYSDNSMSSIRKANNTTFENESKGLGDVKLSALINLEKTESVQSLFSFGISLPTGKIDEKGTMANGTEGTLGYGMQLGSGTYDLLPGYTYRAFLDNFSWGFQAKAVLRTGRNDKSYALGNKFTTSFWAEKGLNDSFSTSLRSTFTTTGKVSGRHDDFANTKMAPAFDANSTGGNTLSLGLGLNYLCHSGVLKNYRTGVEFLVPVFQDLNGVQLKTNSMIVFGIQKAL